MNRFKYTAVLLSAFLFCSVVLPAHAFSFTPAQISSVIQLLQAFNADPAVIADVQANLNGQATPVFSTSCPKFSYNLSVGSIDAQTGGQVSQLQQFLGIIPTTGYFGPITLRAVQQWQSSNGIVYSGTFLTTGYGRVGPKTRASIAASCTKTPTPLPQQSCTFNGQSIANNSYVTAYQSSSVAYGSTCISQPRTCTNGTLSGTYAYSSCAVTQPNSCSLDGSLIANGASVTAYQSSSVAYGSSCVQQTRTCSGGAFSGSYAYASCTVQSPTCGILPVGSSLTLGQSITSCNGKYRFILQGSSGNLILYDISTSPVHVQWQSGTGGKSATKLVMQTDGNLVLYDVANTTIWESHSFGIPKHLELDNNGSLDIHTPDGKTLWPYNTVYAEDDPSGSWTPSWLPGSDTFSFDPAVNPNYARYGCNASVFGTTPALGDIYVGRLLNSGDCSGGNWSLTLLKMDWANRSLGYLKKVLDTSRGSVLLSDGYKLTTAYDPTVAQWNGELWVAFECWGQLGVHTSVGSCVGPLRADDTLDTDRTTVVVGGGSIGTVFKYSASVPKLVAYQGHLYLYWTAVKMFNSTPNSNWISLTSRGTELKQEPSGLKRIWAVSASGAPMGVSIFPDSPTTVEVMGLDASDPRSNKVGDMYQTIAGPDAIYFTAGRGGGVDCLNSLGTSDGCYRLTIGRTTDPLAYHTFNQNLIPDRYLPPYAQGYYRFTYRPSDGKTILLGGLFRHVLRAPRIDGVIKAFPWQDNLLSAATLPAKYSVEPLPAVPTSKNQFIRSLYQCVLDRQGEARGIATYEQKSATTTLAVFYKAFFNSAEYRARATSDTKYAGDLSHCILYRQATASDIQLWVAQLATTSRSALLDSFYASSEFQNGVGKTVSTATGFPILSSTVIAPSTHTLARGWTGEEVSALQATLTKLGIYTAGITSYFGSLTEAAVKTLQTQNNLAAVGIVGPQTRQLLNILTK